jgi:hypothetical protein
VVFFLTPFPPQNTNVSLLSNFPLLIHSFIHSFIQTSNADTAGTKCWRKTDVISLYVFWCVCERKVHTCSVTESLLSVLQGRSQLMQVLWVPCQKDGSRQPLMKVKCTSSIMRREPHRGLIPGYVSIFALSTVFTVTVGLS